MKGAEMSSLEMFTIAIIVLAAIVIVLGAMQEIDHRKRG
jgi:hypothetical protein